MQEELSNKKSELAQREQCIEEIHKKNEKLKKVNIAHVYLKLNL